MVGSISSGLPLIIFTALLPVASGAFIGIALLNLIGEVGENKKSLDKLSLIPFGLMVLGVAASFFHLETPANTYYMIEGVGRSPLSNEITLTAVLIAITALYLIVALANKAGNGFRKIVLIIIIVAAFAQVISMGLAYSIKTIPSWASIWPSVQLVGLLLIGSAFGGLIASSAKSDEPLRYRQVIAAVVSIGALLTVAGSILHLVDVKSMVSPVIHGSELVSIAMPYAVILIISSLLSAIACIVACKKEQRTTLYGIATALLFIAAFCARIAFFYLELGVGF